MTNLNYIQTKRIKLTWTYFNKFKILDEIDITIYVKNQFITLKRINNVGSNVYEIINPCHVYHVFNKIFIFEKDDLHGFGKIVNDSFNEFV